MPATPSLEFQADSELLAGFRVRKGASDVLGVRASKRRWPESGHRTSLTGMHNSPATEARQAVDAAMAQPGAHVGGGVGE
ncbi:MAG: hypothetical protein V2A73_02550 [Pseudomonadota bacterium]